MENLRLAPEAAALEQAGKSLFEAGKFQQAATTLQQAIATYQAHGDSLGAAIATSNLALVYANLGQWDLATPAILTSLTTMQRLDVAQDQPHLLGQVLKIQGQLHLDQGQSQAALDTWQQAEVQFTAGQDASSVIRSRINQAQALKALGQSRRAITLLTNVVTDLAETAPSQAQVLALRSLGDTHRVVGNLDQSLAYLQQSLDMGHPVARGIACGGRAS